MYTEEVADIDVRDNTLVGFEEEIDLPQKRGTVYSSAFTIANATLGAGLLGLPFLLNAAGLVLGVFLLLFFGILANFTLKLLHLDTLLANGQSYEAIGQQIFGLWGAIPVMVCVIGINFGALISYTIIIGDFLSPLGSTYIGEDSLFANKVFVQLIITVVVLIPLCLMRSIVDLKWLSVISLVVAYLFIGVVVFQWGADVADGGANDTYSYGEIRYATIDMSLFQTIGVPVFAYASHTVLLPITTEMEDNSYPAVGKAVNLANAICVISFVVCGSFGYLTFRDETEGNILNNYNDGDIIVDVIRVLMTIVICFTYPLCMVPSRFSLDNLIFHTFECEMKDGCPKVTHKTGIEDDLELCTIQWPHLPSSSSGSYLPSLHPTTITSKTLRFIFETFVIAMLAFLLAANIPDVEVVFSFVGGTFSSCTSYIFPGIFYLKIRGVDREVSVGRVCFATFVTAFGAIMAVVTTASTIYGAVA